MQTILNNPLPRVPIRWACARRRPRSVHRLHRFVPGVSQTWIVSANAFALRAAFRRCSVRGMDIPRASCCWASRSCSRFMRSVSLMQFMASADALQGLVFWTLGSLARSDWPKIGVLAVASAPGRDVEQPTGEHPLCES